MWPCCTQSCSVPSQQPPWSLRRGTSCLFSHQLLHLPCLPQASSWSVPLHAAQFLSKLCKPHWACMQDLQDGSIFHSVKPKALISEGRNLFFFFPQKKEIKKKDFHSLFPERFQTKRTWSFTKVQNQCSRLRWKRIEEKTTTVNVKSLHKGYIHYISWNLCTHTDFEDKRKRVSSMLIFIKIYQFPQSQ